MTFSQQQQQQPEEPNCSILNRGLPVASNQEAMIGEAVIPPIPLVPIREAPPIPLPIPPQRFSSTATIERSNVDDEIIYDIPIV